MKFTLYKDKAGEWRWRLRHGNGNISGDIERRLFEQGIGAEVHRECPGVGQRRGCRGSLTLAGRLKSRRSAEPPPFSPGEVQGSNEDCVKSESPPFGLSEVEGQGAAQGASTSLSTNG